MTVGVSESALMRADARRAVGSHLNVQWVDASVPELDADVRSKAEAYQQFCRSIPEVMKGESPSLIFVFSDEMKPKAKSSKSREEQPTAQAKASAAAWIELFQTEGDYSVFIPGRFFNIFRVDATTVTDAGNKYLCSEKAPRVILTRRSGDVVTFFEGRAKIKRRGIVSAMSTILRSDNIVENMRPFGRLHNLMKALEQAEFDLIKAGKKMTELRDKLATAEERDAKTARRTKKSRGPSNSTIQAKKAVEKFEVTTLYKTDVSKYVILKEEYALLKEIGLPEEKMPTEPVEPGTGSRPTPSSVSEVR